MEEVLKTMEQILLYVHLQYKQQLVVVMEITQVDLVVVVTPMVIQVVLQEVLEQHVKVILVEQVLILHNLTILLVEIIIEQVAVVVLVLLEQMDFQNVIAQLKVKVEMVKQLQ